MITLQARIVAELKAYKQSVITEAETKGLNPDVPMKDSGIEWIGEIPEHWAIAKLNHFLSKVGSGSTPTGGSNVYTNQGVKFLRSQNVYFEGLKLDDIVYITEEIDESMKGTRVLVGDVLLNITGGSIGRCFYVDSTLGRANVNQHVSILRPKTICTKYLKYFLQSEVGQHQVRLYQTGGNREGLSASAIKEFRFFKISAKEQENIAEYLDTQCTEIDNLISIKLSKIDSLKEYKKSIIYEYVTGKKEVANE
jgi:type I restriction enzyme S subunit